MSCAPICCADFVRVSKRIINHCARGVDRVWQAVRAFFVGIAQTIADAIRNCRRRPPEAYYPLPSACNNPIIFDHKVPLADKLALFSNLPYKGSDFINRLVDLYMSAYLLLDEHKDFNRDFKAIETDVVVLVSFLSVRAIVFCKDPSNLRSLPVFLEHRDERDDERDSDPRTVRERAIALREVFQDLPTKEQITILQQIIPSDIPKLYLSVEGGNVLREIGTLAHALHTGNRAFNEALGAAVKQRSKPT